jgi:hypothetical protein
MIDVKKSHTHPVKSQTDSDNHEIVLALVRLLAPQVAAELSKAADASRPYSQRDGERPPGCGRAKFLRAHRLLVAAGDAGAWSEGRARLISRDAWSRFARDERPAPTPPASSSRPVDEDSAALESLGLARGGGGR